MLHRLGACPALALVLGGCCTTIPEVDRTVPMVSLRVFDSESSQWFRSTEPDSFTQFDTRDEFVHVQLHVADEGGIGRVLVRGFHGRLVHRNDTYTFEHVSNETFDFLLHDGNRECADDKLNKVFEARPRAGIDIIDLRVLVEDFGGRSGPPNTTEPPGLFVRFL